MLKANLTEADLDRIWALLPYVLRRTDRVARPSHLAEAFATAAAMYVDCRMAIQDGFADNGRGCRVVDGPRGLVVVFYNEPDTVELVEDGDTWDVDFHGRPPDLPRT